MDDKNEAFLCPSAPLTTESFLFGILNENAEVDYVDKPISVTKELLNGFVNIKSPEKHFRFTMECGECKCAQWDEGKCSIGATISGAKLNNLGSEPVKCSIRKACRWFYQEGLTACSVCKYIVTDVSID